MLNKSIRLIDKTLKSIATPGQSEPGSNVKVWVTPYFQEIQNNSLTNAYSLMSPLKY